MLHDACFTADFFGSGLGLTLHGRPHGSSIIINNKVERWRYYALDHLQHSYKTF
jgi:hypothetical protein